MPARMNRQIVLAARPHGEPTEANFKLVETPVPDPGPGKMLLRTLYLSLDPYMRGRMSAGPSYAAPTEIGEVMGGGTVCRVEAAPIEGFEVDDTVVAFTGWQDYALSDGKGVRKINPSLAPVTTALGVLGTPGMTAWAGLKNIGQPKAGETLVVASASGAVGSVVGQLAKLKGCRAVGIAGGEKKCRYVVDELGFDACVDHRRSDFAQALEAACPKGIDIDFENVGGAVFDAVIPLLNAFARVPVCGLIAHYNATELPSGVDRVPLLDASGLDQATDTPRVHRHGLCGTTGRLPGRSRPARMRWPHQIPRGHRRRPGERAVRLDWAAQGRELWQIDRTGLAGGGSEMSEVG